MLRGDTNRPVGQLISHMYRFNWSSDCEEDAFVFASTINNTCEEPDSVTTMSGLNAI
jgi:hypothetical protein